MRKMTQEEFVERCTKMHNGHYSYDNTVYVRMHDKVTITCPVHGDYLQFAKEHINGAGCRRCSKLYTTEKFIDRAIEVHGEKYDYSQSVYIGTNDKVIIICPIHGSFIQIPNVHLQGSGCRYCAPNLRKDTESFVNQAKHIHANFYDYSKTVYTLATEELIVTCPEHGDFQQVAYRHLQYQGCPRCGGRASKPALAWLEWISKTEEVSIQHRGNGKEFLIPGTRFSVDGYCADTNTVYEFHGDYWHGNPNVYNHQQVCKQQDATFGELYHRTLNRDNHIKALGYNLVVMWEAEWKELKGQLEENTVGQ